MVKKSDHLKIRKEPGVIEFWNNGMVGVSIQT